MVVYDVCEKKPIRYFNLILTFIIYKRGKFR